MNLRNDTNTAPMRPRLSPQPSTRTPDPLLARIACLAISLALSVGIAEVFLRTFSDLHETGYRPSANPRLVYELEPGHRVTWLNASISPQGLNDRVFDLEKPPGVFRIAVVGDSTAFGWKVGGDKSLVKDLERSLNRLQKRRYEVMNFAVPGYNTSQELEVIRDRVLSFHPDMVLLIFTGNDVNVCNYIIPQPTALGWLAHRSYLLHLLLRTIDGSLATPSRVGFAFPEPWLWFKHEGLGMFYPRQKIYPRPGLEETEYDGDNPPKQRWWVPQRYWYMLGYRNYRGFLAEIRDLLAAKKIAFVSSGMLTEEALKVHRELGIEHVAVGLWPEELERDFHPTEPLVLPNDGHYTAAGHTLAAQRIFEYLVANDLI